MATYTLIAEITANTATKRDAIYSRIETWLSGKAVWGKTEMSKGTDMETGLPSMSIIVRFTQRPNLDNLFEHAKTEINKLTGVTIRVSKHICHHDDGSNQACEFEPLVTIVK